MPRQVSICRAFGKTAEEMAAMAETLANQVDELKEQPTGIFFGDTRINRYNTLMNIEVDQLQEYYQMRQALSELPDFPDIYERLLDNLGDTDSDKREASLAILWQLIDKDALTDDMMINTGNRMLENLLVGLGGHEDNSIFLRSFSVLIIGALVAKDEIRRLADNFQLHPFLNEDMYRIWFDSALEYVGNEKDFRGFIPVKGWAHSISHSADVLSDLAFHRYSRREDHIRIMELLGSQLMKHDNEAYINNDDNRMASVVVTIMLREKLALSDYREWLQGIISRFAGRGWRDFYSNRGTALVWLNVTAFLRALYFLLQNGMRNKKGISFFDQKPEKRDDICSLIIETLKQMDNGLNYS